MLFIALEALSESLGVGSLWAHVRPRKWRYRFCRRAGRSSLGNRLVHRAHQSLFLCTWNVKSAWAFVAMKIVKTPLDVSVSREKLRGSQHVEKESAIPP